MAYPKVKGALKKGYRLGLLEGERGNGERVKICVTTNVKGGRIWGTKKVNGALEKG